MRPVRTSRLAHITLVTLLATSLSSVPMSRLGAQAGQDAPGWNSRQTLELVARGRAQRRGAAADSSLGSYRAEATGHLYFLLDRDDSSRRSLIKADQLALEVYWQAPGHSRQHIVGRRDEARLPTNIRYHLDHLTVVTDDFDDRIALGEGDEVRSVIHPLAPGSGSVYDFRLGDSLTVSFPGRGDEIRVYEVQVRPRDPTRPGVVGSVYLDRASAAVVRMGLTFTPASYVDPYLDHIRVTLDNGLWKGRYWLPYRQELEIRRELPYLDLPAGTVIRVRYDIGDYTLNPELPPDFFSGPRVRARSEEALASYPFDEGLYAHLDDEGLAPTPDLEEVRREARQMVADRGLSGLGSLRLLAPSASGVLRHDRAEGIRLGAGASFDFRDDAALRLGAGYAFGRERPDASLELTRGAAGPGTGIRLFWNDLRDLGPVAGASGAVSSLWSLALEDDYRDPWFASGLHAFHRLGDSEGPRLGIRVRLEEHDEAEFVLDDPAAYRPLPSVDEGTLTAVDVDLTTELAADLTLETGVTLGRLEEEEWLEVRSTLDWVRSWLEEDVVVDTRLQAGALTSSAPLQSLYRLGGRNTLPGFPYREFGGDGYWLLGTSASWGLMAPWVRPRLLAAAGSTYDMGGSSFDRLRLPATGEPRVSVGTGIGLFWDILRVDAVRGLDGGGWEWILSVSHEFWPLL